MEPRNRRSLQPLLRPVDVHVVVKSILLEGVDQTLSHISGNVIHSAFILALKLSIVVVDLLQQLIATEVSDGGQMFDQPLV